ncbi:MAG: hypothetical protein VW491_03140 [Gammaproteobacteria bacterium]
MAYLVAARPFTSKMTTPAYGIDPETLVDAPQCSSSGEFCFLCAFEPDTRADGDAWQSIVDLINNLVEAKREIPAIVRTVVSVYDHSVRPSLVYTHPDTGATVERPRWSGSSVRRHLLFSEQFPKLFGGVVTCMLHSIIVRYNASMIDEATGAPIEETRKAFVDTLKALQRWEGRK